MSKKNIYIKNLCLSAVMSALYVCLELLTEPISALLGGQLKISLSGLPIIIMSLFGGTVWGMLTGFIGEFATQMLTYGFTPTTLLWVLPPVIRGLSMGILFILFKRSTKAYIIIIETVISSVLVTLANTGVMALDFLILTYNGDYNYYGSMAAILAGVPLRIISGVVSAVIFAIVLPPIIRLMKNKI